MTLHHSPGKPMSPMFPLSPGGPVSPGGPGRPGSPLGPRNVIAKLKQQNGIMGLEGQISLY